MPANIWILFTAQALASCAAPLMIFAGGLASRTFAPSPALATLPVAALVVGTALSVYPASQLSARFGRRQVFIGAMLIGCLGAWLSMYALQLQSFTGFVLTSLLLGSVQAVIQQFRFAAMESVAPELMPVAASRLLAAGLVSAWLGPELVSLGQNLYQDTFSGAFVLLSGLFMLALTVLAVGFTEPPQVSGSGSTAPGSRLALLQHSGFLVAALSAGVGYGVMSFIMTATPVSMHEMQAFSLEDTKLVIQSHIMAMFIPSLFAGRLIVIFGHVRMIWLGLLAFLFCIGLGLWDSSWLHYWWALVLLGVGWNFLFVAGTSLLPRMYAPEQSHQAQGVNDAVVFSTQAVGALSASAVLYMLGWSGVLLISLVPMVLMAGVLFVWLGRGKPEAA